MKKFFIIVFTFFFFASNQISYSKNLNIIENERNIIINNEFKYNNNVELINYSLNKNKDFNPLFVNLIIPGFTQIYYGEQEKGIFFFLGTIFSFVIPHYLKPLSRSYSQLFILIILEVILAPIIYVWSLLDASFMIENNKNNFDYTSFSNTDTERIYLVNFKF